MDDGGITHQGQTILHTNSFVFSDVCLLQDALLVNFGLKTRLTEKVPGQWLIVIPIKQQSSLHSIVSPYMLPEFSYKVRKPYSRAV